MCIDGAFIECTKNERRVFKQGDRSPKRDPDFWNVIVGFMFYERTDGQIKRLVESMSECKCQLNGGNGIVEQYHKIAELNSARQEYDFSLMMISAQNEGTHPEVNTFNLLKCAWVLDIFQSLCFAALDAKLRTASKALAHSWPIGLTDFFPFGTDNFVRSILQWHHLVPDSGIFQFVMGIIGCCQMLVIPHLIEHRFADRMIQSTRKVVDRAMMDIVHLSDVVDMKY